MPVQLPATFSSSLSILIQEGGCMESNSNATTVPTVRQFSLRSLLLVVGGACLLLAPSHWFGGVYLFSASCSVVLIFLCTLAFRVTPAMAILPAALGVITGFVLAIGLLVFFFHALLNGLACLVLPVFRPRTRVFVIALAGVMAIVYGFAFSQGAAKLSELRDLRVRYAFESLSSRLAFERSDDSQDPFSSDVINLSPTVASNLQKQDLSQSPLRHYFSRAEALRDLHEDSSAEFARAAGFGFMRMPSLTYRLVDFEQPEPLLLPTPIGIAQLLPSAVELDTVHRVATTDFLLADRMGYIKSRDAVAGFESHQFSRLNRSWEGNLPAAKHWQVVRLELVGLLRDKPRVYVSETLPPMDKIAEAPHRQLNDFEAGALPQLISQEDVVADQQPERIQMLGALRASAACLQCHEGANGKLLGAFSYEIMPVSVPARAVRTVDN
jgi:hypothetical protein